MIDKTGHIDWEMAARLLAGEGDEIDRGLFNRWIEQSEANRVEWNSIRAAWESGSEALMMNEVDDNAGWERVRNDAIEGGSVTSGFRVSRVRMMGVAAAFVLTLGLVWFFFRPFSQPSSSLIVTNSEKEEVVLSDGSIVTLNVGSGFSCVQPFNVRERTVELKGEGFFKVEGNNDWPFVVEAGGLMVRVVGTGFNVRSYPYLEVVEVAVVDGVVEVMPLENTGDRVTLQAGEMALFRKDKRTLRVQQMDDPNLLGWITRKLKFQETSLDKVFDTIERVYRVKIQPVDATILSEKLTAQFSDNSLDFVLNVICMTFNLEMEREGSVILLSRE